MPEFETTQQDATNVVQIPEDPVQEAIAEAHVEASIRVLTDSGAGVLEGAVKGATTGRVAGEQGALVGAVAVGYFNGMKSYALSVVQNCWVTCHNQWPPKEPVPAPEIETEEEEKKEKDEGN